MSDELEEIEELAEPAQPVQEAPNPREVGPVADFPLDDKFTPEMAVASALIPWDFDDERALYFGYRACGLSVRETLHLVNRTKSWLANCRHLYPGKEKFCEIEGKLPELRHELAHEHIELDFFRNFRLVMEKDYRILRRSLGLEKGEDNKTVPMTPYDHSYLIRMRTQYNPQSLAILEAVAKDKGNFNFADWVAKNQDIIQLSRTDTVTLKRSRGNGDSEE